MFIVYDGRAAHGDTDSAAILGVYNCNEERAIALFLVDFANIDACLCSEKGDLVALHDIDEIVIVHH